jgi:hypothetical protein
VLLLLLFMRVASPLRPWQSRWRATPRLLLLLLLLWVLLQLLLLLSVPIAINSRCWHTGL